MHALRQRGRPLGSRSGLAAAKARPSGAKLAMWPTRTITRVRKNERLAKDMVR